MPTAARARLGTTKGKSGSRGLKSGFVSAPRRDADPANVCKLQVAKWLKTLLVGV